MTLRCVGILGGMGPQATVLLLQRILAATQAKDDADHIPLIVDQNPQVPSRIAHLIEGTGPDPAPVLVSMAQRLQAAGAEALAMPCNTAHHYAPALRAACEAPLIDMVALSASAAAQLAGLGGKVGVLASPAVRKTGLYERALAGHGMTAVFPPDEAALLAAIRSIKGEGPGPAARAALKAASKALLQDGARVQMIACTEFSLIPEALDPKALAIDTLDILVSGIIAFSRQDHDTDTRAKPEAPLRRPNQPNPTQPGEVP